LRAYIQTKEIEMTIAKILAAISAGLVVVLFVYPASDSLLVAHAIYTTGAFLSIQLHELRGPQ
jgi:hypothetical protein